MTIFKNGKEIVEFYKDGKAINEIYHGDKLIFSTLRPGTIIIDDAGTGDRIVEFAHGGYFQIDIVGGGGNGGGWLSPYVSGGSGGTGAVLTVVGKFLKNEIRVYYSGTNMQASTFESLIVANGTAGAAGAVAGVGGALPSGDFANPGFNLVDIIKCVKGNNGRGEDFSFPGWNPSVFDGSTTGPGAGGPAAYPSAAGMPGLIRITYLGKGYTPISRTLTFNIDVPADITIDGDVVAQGVTTYDATMAFGQTINYEVSATGYTTDTGSYTWNTADTTDTLSITLNP
jgi:hypothetical protein